MTKIIITILISYLIVTSCGISRNTAPQQADKPLFRDPVFDGAADPVVVWNKQEKKWFMFYTNRRAKADSLDGVTWVHGTRIGIAESKDGSSWKYRDTANINFRPTADYTHWAPEVIEHQGTYHMYLTYVPGIFTDWKHPRNIVHLTSKNLFDWEYQSTLNLVNEKVIDACVYPKPEGGWRMWYNNEMDGKSIYYADSEDLYHWTEKGKAIAARGEGPKVFQWKGKYWMVIDAWRGILIYHSDDLLKWTLQKNVILKDPGKGTDDGVMGGHPDVVVNEDRAFIFYFTHPGKTPEHKGKDGYEQRRSSLQLAELEYKDGEITCDRDKPVYIRLKP